LRVAWRGGLVWLVRRPCLARRPFQNAWRVTLPLEHPVTGLPPPASEAERAEAAAARDGGATAAVGAEAAQGWGGGGRGPMRPPPCVTLLLSAEPWCGLGPQRETCIGLPFVGAMPIPCHAHTV
jgi:hypothetical protein